jgi:hypothetical protein
MGTPANKHSNLQNTPANVLASKKNLQNFTTAIGSAFNPANNKANNPDNNNSQRSHSNSSQIQSCPNISMDFMSTQTTNPSKSSVPNNASSSNKSAS